MPTSPWSATTDSYNDGQLLNRLIQTAHVAKASGNDAVFQQAYNLVKQRVENWLTYTSGEKAFLFYYNSDWTAMFGYPAGHGQDEYINDHHFHWGYFIHGGSFYLSRDLNYVRTLWSEIAANTGILSNEENPNLWHDVMWEYLSLINPQKAIELYNSYPQRTLKFGISSAQTYHWLHAMNVLGQYDATITANYPVAMAFRKGETVTHVAYNYGSTPLTVTFSDGATLDVAARSMGTDGGTIVPPTPAEPDAPVVAITAPSAGSVVAVGETVTLQASASVEGSTIAQVDFYVNDAIVGTASTAPYALQWTPPAAGTYSITARATAASGKQTVSAAVAVTVNGAAPVGDVCSVASDELVEGSGMSYKLSFESNVNGDVTVTAEALTDVVGLVAFVRDLTDGFAEVQMQEAGERKFTYTLKGHSVGDAISVACKFAWVNGGIGVTAAFSYVVGSKCGHSSVERELTDSDVRIYPVPATDRLNVEIAANGSNRIYIWSADGKLMHEASVGTSKTVAVSRWPSGIYFLRVENGNAVKVERFVKR